MERYINELQHIYNDDGLTPLLKDIIRYALRRTLPFTACWRLHNSLRSHIHPLLYSAPADPWKIIHIDPDDVEYYAGGIRISHTWGLAQIEGGEWDRRGSPFEENSTYQSLRQRFIEGRDWEDTDYIEQYNLSAGYNDDPQELIDVRCAYVDNLYEDIKENGYTTNTEGENETAPRRVDSFQDIEYLVAIGRDGEYLHVDGAHRISIAKILDLEEIPVMVAGRHKEWQALRDEVYNAAAYRELSERAKAHLTHPDLADVLDANPHLERQENAF